MSPYPFPLLKKKFSMLPNQKLNIIITKQHNIHTASHHQSIYNSVSQAISYLALPPDIFFWLSSSHLLLHNPTTKHTLLYSLIHPANIWSTYTPPHQKLPCSSLSNSPLVIFTINSSIYLSHHIQQTCTTIIFTHLEPFLFFFFFYKTTITALL